MMIHALFASGYGCADGINNVGSGFYSNGVTIDAQTTAAIVYAPLDVATNIMGAIETWPARRPSTF